MCNRTVVSHLLSCRLKMSMHNCYAFSLTFFSSILVYQFEGKKNKKLVKLLLVFFSAWKTAIAEENYCTNMFVWRQSERKKDMFYFFAFLYLALYYIIDTKLLNKPCNLIRFVERNARDLGDLSWNVRHKSQIRLPQSSLRSETDIIQTDVSKQKTIVYFVRVFIRKVETQYLSSNVPQ